MIFKRLQVFVCAVVVLGGSSLCAAQGESSSFFTNWEDRVRSTLAQQPSWPIPLVTASSGLLQVARTDVVRQIAPAGTDTWNYDNGKGVSLVPWYNLEFDALAPPYIQHNSKAEDGFADFSMLLKYRVVAANEEGGNYSLSVSLTGTLPTGSYKNGSLASTITPIVCGGKGFEGLTCNQVSARFCRRVTPRNWVVQWPGIRLRSITSSNSSGRKSRAMQPSTTAERMTATCRIL